MFRLFTVKRVLACLVAITALGVAATLVPAIETRSDLDSFSVFEDRFIYRLERDGMVVGFFTECSGIGSENEIVEFREGGEGGEIVRKIPGRLKWENIVLKRGISSSLEAWVWRKEVEDGLAPRSDIRITMLRRTGAPVAVWNFMNAWPSRITTSSAASGIAIEELTIAHEGLVRSR